MNEPSDQNPFARRIDETRVAEFLRIIGTPANVRRSPLSGDLIGDFDLWCDGAACKHHTGSAHWDFADGTRAIVATPCTWLWVRFTFSNGQSLEVRQFHNP